MNKWFLKALIKLSNIMADAEKTPGIEPSGLKEFDEVLERATQRSMINDHLATLFLESLSVRPKLIVELGVESGHSTYVFERVARLCGSRLISVDWRDCSDACAWPGWEFVQADDLELAKRWLVSQKIDILFIDTAHTYEQTLKEIKAWFPHLSSKAKVFFHDSNVIPMFLRKDGSLGTTKTDFKRGAIRAIEEYLGSSFDEKEDFTRFCNGWLVEHHSNCNGMTILEKIKEAENA